MASTAYRIQGGQTSTHEIPEGGLLAWETARDCKQVWLHQGKDDAALVPVIANIFSRVVPFGTLWLAPRIKYENSAGVAQAARATAAVQLFDNRAYILECVYHECMHLIDDVLTRGEMDALNAAVEHGRKWPGDDYTGRTAERRARLFAAYAMYMEEGGAFIVSGRAPETKVLAAIYEGEIGRRGRRSGPCVTVTRQGFLPEILTKVLGLS